MPVILQLTALLTIIPIAIFAIRIISRIKVKKWLKAKPVVGTFFDINDRDIHAVIKGNPQGHPVLIIPGLGQSAAEYWPLQDELSRHTQVITFDRPGYGKSDISLKPRKSKEIVNEINCLISKIGIKEPVIILAFGEGALYAQFFARLHPAKVEACILYDPIIDQISWLDKISDKLYWNIIDKTKIINKAKSRGLWGLKVLFNNIRIPKDLRKLHIACQAANPEFYNIWKEEYGFIKDQGSLAVKIAPPFPNVPLKIIYHDNESFMKYCRKHGATKQEAEEMEKISREMSLEYLKLSDNNQWIEPLNAGAAKNQIIEKVLVSLLPAKQQAKKNQKYQMA